MAKRRGRTNRLAVFVSVVVLVGMFAVAVFYVQENTQVITASDDLGSLELIPTVTTTENGTISMEMRYIPIRENVDIFDHIFKNEQVAMMNENHTELYLANRTETTENTHTYRLEKIANGTFIRVLVMPEETFENLTTVQNVIIQNEQGTYTAQVKSQGNNVYLTLSRVQENESE